MSAFRHSLLKWASFNKIYKSYWMKNFSDRNCERGDSPILCFLSNEISEKHLEYIAGRERIKATNFGSPNSKVLQKYDLC